MKTAKEKRAHASTATTPDLRAKTDTHAGAIHDATAGGINKLSLGGAE